MLVQVGAVKRSLAGTVMLADAHHCYSSFATHTSMFGAGGDRGSSKGWLSPTNESVKESAWEIVEANRFFDKHSKTLTLPTPLPDIQLITLTAEADMPDLNKLKNLQVSLFSPCADARLHAKLQAPVQDQLACQLHTCTKRFACRMFAMPSCHSCLNMKLHVRYDLLLEQEVVKLKATGLKQLSHKGRRLHQQVAFSSKWTAPDQQLRRHQQESAFEALRDDMVSRSCECAS